MDIDNLHAGLELDALVEEKVFGRVKCDAPVKPTAFGVTRECNHDPGTCYKPGLKRYSKSMSAAAELENWVNKQGWHRVPTALIGTRPNPTDTIVLAYEKNGGPVVEAAGPFEEALCKVALKIAGTHT